MSHAGIIRPPIQGTVEAQGTVFKDIPPEACPTIRRGSIAWVGSGPKFFISLANHNEWSKAYTVFGYVLPEDMEIVEKMSQLPTRPDVWSKVKVPVLERPVPLRKVIEISSDAKGGHRLKVQQTVGKGYVCCISYL
ncbi:hypothetical protein V6N13_086814 [Hibiscus sabdariffa]